jgi:plastocyanin
MNTFLAERYRGEKGCPNVLAPGQIDLQSGAHVFGKRSRHAACILAAAVLLAISLIGCSGNNSRQSSDEAPPAANPGAQPVDKATTGSITGVINLEGTPPRAKNINMAAVPACAKQHEVPATTEEVVLGDNGALQNVVVYLKGDFSRYSFPTSTDPLKVDQKGCQYEPHVVALMTGEPLDVSNADGVSHNVNATAKLNRGWNQTQAPGAVSQSHQFSREEVAIAVSCNIHRWMRFYIAVIDNPYFQVTDKDGTFILKDVPPGTYTLTAWHELYGTKEQVIMVTPNKQQTVTMTFTDRDSR